MAKVETHMIYDQDENGQDTGVPVAEVNPASPEAVKTVLDAPVEGMDGRSNWVWVRFNNGDLILGVYPQGETYFDVEQDSHTDSEDAEMTTYTVLIVDYDDGGHAYLGYVKADCNHPDSAADYARLEERVIDVEWLDATTAPHCVPDRKSADSQREVLRVWEGDKAPML